jgi:hypothetical protein
MKAILKSYRDTYSKKSIISKLHVNDTFICDILEDVSRDLNRDGDLNDLGETKIHGETAIPAGTYKMIINISPRFKKLLPRLINVPGFDGVLIHTGNQIQDTHGCLLVGTRGIDCIKGGTSTPAMTKLMKELAKYDEYEIQIIDKKL